jgi:ribosomal protein S18 acetylase RimI-like enzyme
VSVKHDGITIRRIRAVDGELLRRLRLRSLEESPEAFGQTFGEASARPMLEWHRNAMRSSRGDLRTWLMAQREQDIVGLVQGRHRSPAALLVFSMWVEPAARRLGVGRRLIDALESWAQAWQAEETILWVLRANQPAVDFYRRLGFVVLGSGLDAESGAGFGALAMRRTIGLPPA